jgi:hypothetical protein
MSDRKDEQVIYAPGIVPAQYDPAWFEAEMHRIAAAMDPASVPVMIAPTFEGTWVNHSATPDWEHAGFYKDMHGRVHLQGLVKDGTLNSVIFYLPVGYRPVADHIFIVANSGTDNACRVDVKDDGTVIQTDGDSNSWVSLAGISFALTGR